MNCLLTGAVFVPLGQTQVKTDALKEDTLELKTWNKHTKNYADDTEVNSHLLVGRHSFLSPSDVC